MEVEFLMVLDFKLSVTSEEYDTYSQMVQAFYLGNEILAKSLEAQIFNQLIVL
jgi:hypothetical protein